MRLNDEQLQQQVAEAVGRKLGPQMGRARRVFLNAVAGTQPAPTRPTLRFRPWMLLGFGSAAAAALLVLTLRPTSAPDAPDAGTGSAAPVVASSTNEPSNVQHAVFWEPIDEQTVYVNGQVPARSIRGVRVDEVQWFDPRLKAHVRLTVPRQQVVLTSLMAH
jgi:hypothetical protein